MPKEQETEDFEALFRTYYVTVVAYALRRSPTPHDAADVVSATFETAWRRRTNIPAVSAALPWLLTTAQRVMANQRRRDHNRSDVVQRLALEFERATAGRGAPIDEEALVVRQVFAELSAEDREVLGLFGWESLAGTEIAAAMGLTLNTARVRLHRARSRFSQALRAAGVELDDKAVGTLTSNKSEGGPHADGH